MHRRHAATNTLCDVLDKNMQIITVTNVNVFPNANMLCSILNMTFLLISISFQTDLFCLFPKLDVKFSQIESNKFNICSLFASRGTPDSTVSCSEPADLIFH